MGFLARTAWKTALGLCLRRSPRSGNSIRSARTRPRTTEGRLTRVRIPRDRSTAVADLIEPALGGPGCDNLLVEMPRELAFFGAGQVVLALADEVPSSWWGGALPERGFWGAALTDRPFRARLHARIRELVDRTS